MNEKIFVNLPVADLNRSINFFKSLGFSFNPQFTDETATCMVVSDSIFVMLLTLKKFQEFTKKPIVDAMKATEVLLCLALDEKAAVDAMMAKALDFGGTEACETRDHGFMYERSFEDPDGHIWELVWMDPSFGN